MEAVKNLNAFKASPLGPIPVDWEVKELGEIGGFSKGKGILKDQVLTSGLPCIRYGEIYTVHDYFIKQFCSFISQNVAAESKRIKKGEILFAGSGETLEDIGKAVAYLGSEEAYAGGDIIILTPNGKVDAKYVSFLLNTPIANRQKRELGQGHSVVHIYASDLATLKLPLPSLKEQIKIADIITTWDKAIEKTTQLIAQKEHRKR